MRRQSTIGIGGCSRARRFRSPSVRRDSVFSVPTSPGESPQWAAAFSVFAWETRSTAICLRFGVRGWGGFAEYVCAPERALAPKPARMTFEQAAALPQAGQLAVQGLFANGPLRAGQRILINGAGGGVGTIAIQLAKLQDVEVTGVDSAAKLEMMRSLGFDHVIDYTKEDFTRNGRRYDLILDTKTTRTAFEYARSLNPRGTYATVGGPEIARLLRVAIVGWWIGVTTDKAVRLIGLRQNRDLPYLNERFEAGQLVPVIDGPYRLSEARDAFRHFGAGHHKGKVVFTID